MSVVDISNGLNADSFYYDFERIVSKHMLLANLDCWQIKAASIIRLLANTLL